MTLTLLEIRDKVADVTSGCWDEEATLGNLAVMYAGGYNFLDSGQMTDIARSQFLGKAGVPTKCHGAPFFDELSQETQRRVVQERVLNKPLADKPILARWHDETLRAVVSNYYTCVPHLSVVEALMSKLSFTVRGFWPENITAESKTMHLRLTTPTIHLLDGQSDEGFTMIHVANSEVGRGALTVDVGIFRVVCTNGLIAKIGGTLLLRERHIYKDPLELIGLFNEAIGEAEAVAADFSLRLDEARQQQISIDHAMELLPSNRMRGLVQESLGGDTLFDFYNAVTQVAQGYTYEAQFNLERWARTLLDRDWSEHVHIEGEYCPECGREF